MSTPPPMTYRTLGRTNLLVSRVALGAGGPSRLGLAKNDGSAQVDRLIKQALDLGINFIDTAPGYDTENAIGTALQSVRNPLYLATKVWCYPSLDVTDPHQPPLTDPQHLVTSVEESLKALRRDHLDILQLHGVPGPAVEPMIEHFIPPMLRLREQGKIRYIGITEHPGIDPQQDMAAAACTSDLFDVLMIQYGIFDQQAQHRTFALAQEHDVGILGMCAARAAFTDSATLEHLLAQIDPEGDSSLEFLLQGSVRSYADAAFRFAAAREEIHTVLVGTGNVDHLVESTAAILGDPLPPAHLEQLTQRFGHLDGQCLWPKRD